MRLELANCGFSVKMLAAAVEMRWSSGFVCPKCGESRHCSFERNGLKYWQCSACREQTTVMCGAIFQLTKLPLTTRFLGMHLLTQAKNNVSALELKSQISLGRSITRAFGLILSCARKPSRIAFDRGNA